MKGRYAAMALCDLASKSDGRPMVLAEIAERQRISLSYLEQLFSRLRRGGLVKSFRGPGGGYLLARTPEETRISEIVRAVDEPAASTRCTPGQPFSCRRKKDRCLTHDLWEGLDNRIDLYLSSVTLADVISHRISSSGGPTGCPGAPLTLDAN